ncbi:probable polyol transporter 6 [Drosophila subpulchrella]|uniref:probable polyol transporter 6 n=1 Tax=Drosophila subpulchrella TaxID=1486046 RepID=UPI0018A14721|nr:probable polyol transporter 6 [Drosophila subpulchrella]
MTITYVTAGPDGVDPNAFTIKNREEIYIPKAPPPQPPLQRGSTITNLGSLRQVNKQLNVACAVFFLFVYGGMDFAHSAGWNQTLNTTATPVFKCSWFDGVLVGAAVASQAMTFLPKMTFYVLGGIMQLIGSIIFTCAPFHYGCLLAARYVAGAGIGLIKVPFLIHSAEVASDNYRGVSGSMEQCGLALGIAIQVIYDTQWGKEASVNEVHGIIGIVFSLLGLGMTALSIESPEDLAFEEEIYYVQESQKRTFFQELWSSVVPFIKLLLYRGFVAFSFSLPLSESLIKSTLQTEGYISCWPVTVWGMVLLLGALVAQGFLDKMGRKLLSLVCLLCMAILMLGMAVSYADPANVLLTYYMNQVWKLGVAFQAFAGLFVCSSSVYLGEAFPMKVKPFLLGYIVSFEQTVHIINIFGFNRGSETFFYHYYLSVGIILFVGVIFFGLVIPETKKIKRKRFQRLHNIGLF